MNWNIDPMPLPAGVYLFFMDYQDQIVIVYLMLQWISPPVTLKETKRKNEAEVANKFFNGGFVNITKEVISNLITGWIVKVGSVENITIDERSDFTKKEKFRPDAQIKIFYHAFRKSRLSRHQDSFLLCGSSPTDCWISFSCNCRCFMVYCFIQEKDILSSIKELLKNEPYMTGGGM